MVEQNIKIMTAADQLFYLYGYPPFLKILDHYEKNEDFDVCFSMLQTLKKINDTMGYNFPTKWHDKIVENFLKDGFVKDKQGYLNRFDEYIDRGFEFTKVNRKRLILNT